MKKIILLSVFIYACANTTRASILSAHAAGLADCIEKGQQAHSKKVYQDCKDKLDVDFGVREP